MARQPRGLLGDGIFHVTARGVARSELFLDRADFAGFAALLASVVERFRWRCHAYCLMPNHYHLVVETPRVKLSRGMHRLNFLYAQSFNDRYDRVGHLFQNRFGARLIESTEYLADACTYVRMNPVRAGLCRSADDWPWSGPAYAATAFRSRP
jgi:putative transposase